MLAPGVSDCPWMWWWYVATFPIIFSYFQMCTITGEEWGEVTILDHYRLSKIYTTDNMSTHSYHSAFLTQIKNISILYTLGIVCILFEIQEIWLVWNLTLTIILGIFVTESQQHQHSNELWRITQAAKQKHILLSN